MGLSGAKAKQKIQDDPRNLRWAQDTSAPGYRLLASMGWDPDKKASLGITAPTFTKKIAAVPTAKDDMLGLGARKGGAALAGPRSMLSSTSSSYKMGFVTAGATAQTEEQGKKAGGGEFGSLLARLNSASATPTSTAPVSDAEKELPPTPRSLTVNPRIASRAKHLKSKRMAAADALAMSEILGIAPSTTTSGSASPAVSPAPKPVSGTTEVQVVEASPVPVPVSMETKPKFPMFSAGKTIESTFEEPTASTSAVTLEASSAAPEQQESNEKAEKRKRKEEKRAKKEAKKLAAANAASSTNTVDAQPVESASESHDPIKDHKEKKKKKRKRESEATMEEQEGLVAKEEIKSKKRKAEGDASKEKESKEAKKARKAAKKAEKAAAAAAKQA